MPPLLTEHSLPIILGGLIVVSLCHYILGDGFDLGIGLLLSALPSHQQEAAIESIAPFWDANESWLILVVALFYIAFPEAQELFQALYVPIVLMLLGLMLRGSALEFWAQRTRQESFWRLCFQLGSYLCALSQGYLVGAYVTQAQPLGIAVGYSLLSSWIACASYGLLGACWLSVKLPCRTRCLRLARICLLQWLCAYVLLMLLTYVALPRPTPPHLITTTWVLILSWRLFGSLNPGQDSPRWRPFRQSALLLHIAVLGHAGYLYPYIIPFRQTLWACAASTETLRLIAYLSLCLLPWTYLYQYLLYRSFRRDGTGYLDKKI